MALTDDFKTVFRVTGHRCDSILFNYEAIYCDKFASLLLPRRPILLRLA